MNAWWNDPPDDGPDPPMCPITDCGGWADDSIHELDGQLECKCEECGHQWMIPAPAEPGPEDFVDVDLGDLPAFEGPEHCPHGNAWESCDACFHAGDLAYDAARERR